MIMTTFALSKHCQGSLNPMEQTTSLEQAVLWSITFITPNTVNEQYVHQQKLLAIPK